MDPAEFRSVHQQLMCYYNDTVQKCHRWENELSLFAPMLIFPYLHRVKQDMVNVLTDCEGVGTQDIAGMITSFIFIEGRAAFFDGDDADFFDGDDAAFITLFVCQ